MELIKPGLNIPFTKYRHIAVVLSSIVNLLVLVLLFTQGPRLWRRLFLVEPSCNSNLCRRCLLARCVRH